MVFPRRGGCLPGKIRTGLFQERIDDLSPDFSRQVINAGSDHLASHADQHYGLAFKARVLAELPDQVWNEGLFEPDVKCRSVCRRINFGLYLVSAAGRKSYKNYE